MTLKFSEFTGKPVDTLSMDWRFECECAAVLGMPGRDARNAYIDGSSTTRGVRQVRGDAAAEQLRKGVLLLHEIRVAAAKAKANAQ